MFLQDVYKRQVISLCTVSSSATGRSCGAPFFLYARHAGLCVIYPASTASDRIPQRQEWMPSTVFSASRKEDRVFYVLAVTEEDGTRREVKLVPSS